MPLSRLRTRTARFRYALKLGEVPLVFQKPKGVDDTHEVSLEARYPLHIVRNKDDTCVKYGTRYVLIRMN